jgi:hypothetical protein
VDVTGTLQFGGKCLDLPGGDTTNGNFVWMWDCTGSANQLWTYDTFGKMKDYPFAMNPYRLRYAADPSKCIDLPGQDTSDGAQLWIWDCIGEDSQPEFSGQSFWIEQYWFDEYDASSTWTHVTQKYFWTFDRLEGGSRGALQKRFIPAGPDVGSGVFLWTCESDDSDWCNDEGFHFVEQGAKVLTFPSPRLSSGDEFLGVAGGCSYPDILKCQTLVSPAQVTCGSNLACQAAFLSSDCSAPCICAVIQYDCSTATPVEVNATTGDEFSLI